MLDCAQIMWLTITAPETRSYHNSVKISKQMSMQTTQLSWINSTGFSIHCNGTVSSYAKRLWAEGESQSKQMHVSGFSCLEPHVKQARMIYSHVMISSLIKRLAQEKEVHGHSTVWVAIYSSETLAWKMSSCLYSSGILHRLQETFPVTLHKPIPNSKICTVFKYSFTFLNSRPWNTVLLKKLKYLDTIIYLRYTHAFRHHLYEKDPTVTIPLEKHPSLSSFVTAGCHLWEQVIQILLLLFKE